MITVAYDPVAQEIVLDPHNGLEPIEVRSAGVEFKVWADGGILSCLVGDGRTLDVAFFIVEEEPMALRIDPLGHNRWLVRFEPLPPPEGGTTHP